MTRSTIEIDRLLAEDRLAGPREALDQIGMGVVGSADQYRVDVVRRLDRSDGSHLGPALPGDRLGGLGHRVGDSGKLGVRVPGNRPGMDFADAPCAKQGKPRCHF